VLSGYTNSGFAVAHDLRFSPVSNGRGFRSDCGSMGSVILDLMGTREFVLASRPDCTNNFPDTSIAESL
jgi:hypothetical protein